ncbi:MAG: molybdate ABC transporter permease subunit [Betaproteobacteria bacterium]|jgi:molybdate transport system permease protein|nr:molybdate ABC transporter permease subunit [Betaproteobacteria bacterium]
MDWSALWLSLKLALATAAVLLPFSVLLARELAWRRFAGRAAVEAFVALPLVLPPTVLGYYLLVAFAPQSALGQAFAALTGGTLAFSFTGLLAASIVFNLPFAVQPVQRAFESVPEQVREAAWLCGMSRWRTLWKVELPLAWPGLLGAFVLTFAHTLGEFGVVLMVGGNIPGETKTIAIAIYDRVQALDDHAAGAMSALLLGISFVSIAVIYTLDRARRHRG